jgi:hypothetical protein
VAWHAIQMTEPLPRSRGTVFTQVLVAAVFLAVIGGSVGLALGLRSRDNTGAGGGGRTAQQTPEQQIPPGLPDGENPSAGPSSVPCEERIEQQAGRGDLVRVRYLKTEQSEVWICRDDGGGLYYQGHRFSPEGRLFLTGVERQGDEYVATSGDGTTVYRVSREQLVIDVGDGQPEVQPATGTGG